MTKYRPTAYETAILTLKMKDEFSQERDKATTRMRISKISLRELSIRKHLKQPFLDEWIYELYELGWSAFPIADEHFAILETSTTEKWARISAKRIRDILREVRSGNRRIIDDIADALIEQTDTEFEEE